MTPTVALVTGASRGAGAGVARALGQHGMIVYVTGRSVSASDARGWDGQPLPGTILETAAQVTAAGGLGVAVACDHADDSQVASVFSKILEEQGRLDILFNNATYIDDELIAPKPFWEKSLGAADILNVGLRSAYVASWHAAKIMCAQHSGLIVFGSSFGANCYMHGPAYGAQKAGVDKMAFDMQHDFTDTGVRAVSLWMGPLRTERALKAAEVHPEQYHEIMQVAENPEYSGHLTWALATDPAACELKGDVFIAAELGERLGVLDDGKQPPSHRAMLGDPPRRSAAVVY